MYFNLFHDDFVLIALLHEINQLMSELRSIVTWVISRHLQLEMSNSFAHTFLHPISSCHRTRFRVPPVAFTKNSPWLPMAPPPSPSTSGSGGGRDNPLISLVLMLALVPTDCEPCELDRFAQEMEVDLASASDKEVPGQEFRTCEVFLS